jgi:hypothetical protein
MWLTYLKKYIPKYKYYFKLLYALIIFSIITVIYNIVLIYIGREKKSILDTSTYKEQYSNIKVAIKWFVIYCINPTILCFTLIN